MSSLKHDLFEITIKKTKGIFEIWHIYCFSISFDSFLKKKLPTIIENFEKLPLNCDNF